MLRPLTISDPALICCASGLPGPDSIAGLIAWWRADSGVTVGGGAPTDGNPIDSWIESENSFDAAQGTAAQQPDYIASAVNGYPAISFPGSASDETLVVADNAILDDGLSDLFTFFAVIKPTVSQLGVLFQSGYPSHTYQWYLTAGRVPVIDHTSGGSPLTATNPLTLGAFNRVGVTRSATTLTHYLNGATNGSAGVGIQTGPGATGIYMGAHPPGFAAPAAVDIAEFLVYDVAITGADAAVIDAYFVDKYSL